MKPEISIIVPVYNIEHYLRECVDSILSQTFTNFEVILVNDGSSDNSGDICKEYAKLDGRVKVINQINKGVSAARNAGIKIAQGAYIGFVDGDDYIDNKMYQELYSLCEESKSDISICKLGREINGKLINKSQDCFKKEMDNKEAMRELFKGVLYRFSLCNKLFRRKCFEDIHFPEGRIHEDLSTTYKLFANANKAVYTNNIGYIYVKRENSILTTRFNEKRLDAFKGWDEILEFMNESYPELSDEFISCFVYGCI
ncbi:glycosyltransferase, partial [Neobacillus sp. MM2021_6]